MTDSTDTPEGAHAWLVARWTEHRAQAKFATHGPWWPRYGGEAGVVYASTAQKVIAELAYEQSDDRPNPNSRHIAANDPAHVIAVCDAALRRLARHAPKPTQQWKLMPQADGILVDHICLHGWDDEMAGLSVVWTPWPCPEVLDDAAPWAGRSDFPALLKATP